MLSFPTFPTFLPFLLPLPRAEYWADSASTVLAPGGSIQRIGYDTAAFEEAVRVIILGQDPSVETELSKVGIIETVKAVTEKKEEEAVEGYKTNKEDLAVVVR